MNTIYSACYETDEGPVILSFGNNVTDTTTTDRRTAYNRAQDVANETRKTVTIWKQYPHGMDKDEVSPDSKAWFFSFGRDPRYPFPDSYLVVFAPTIKQACECFRKHFPNRPGSGALNCADVYEESYWFTYCSKYYPGKAACYIHA